MSQSLPRAASCRHYRQGAEAGADGGGARRRGGGAAAARPWRGAERAWHRAVRGGVKGQGLFLLLSTLLVAIGLPRQVPAFAAGYAFGPVYGSVIALVGQVLACSLDFIWARAIGQEFVRRRFGDRLTRIDKTLSKHTFVTTLTLRLMPVGNNLLLNLAAGLSSVRLLPFLAASAIGFIPQTLVFALFGHGSLPNHAHMLALGGAMFAASALLGIFLFFHARRTA